MLSELKHRIDPWVAMAILFAGPMQLLLGLVLAYMRIRWFHGISPYLVWTIFFHGTVGGLIVLVCVALYRGSAIHHAARSGQKDFVSYCLNHNFRPNARTILGATPLHFAAKEGHTDVARILLAAGADVNAIDYGGNTPLRLAQLRHQTEVVSLLQSHGASDSSDPKLR